MCIRDRLYPFPHHFLIAFILFAVASYTDHLDGKIARKRNLITNFGKFMDCLLYTSAVKKGDYQGELQMNLEDIRQAFMLLDGQ